MVKKVLLGMAALLAVAAVGGFGFVYVKASAFDASMAKVYEIAPLDIHASTDPAVIARGKHIAESIGGCLSCHGDDLGGKRGEPFGPIGVVHGSNLTMGQGGVGKQYTDGQLARLIRHGLRASGVSLRFMPAGDFAWWPDDDLTAIVSFVRTMPPVDRTLPKSHVGMLGKVLDQVDAIPLDIARRIDHSSPRPKTLVPTPTPAYGEKLALLCKGCHGPGLSGGPIPGAPSELPIPANITPHQSGIKAYTKADFRKLMDQGVKPNGKKLDPFMPFETLRAMSDIEKSALWAYLSTLPPKPFGGR